MIRGNRDQLIRILLFVFGLVVVMLGVLLVFPGMGADAPVLLFTLIDAFVLYEVLVGPLFLGDSIEELTGGKIASLGVVYWATVPYTIFTLGILFVANTTYPAPLVKLAIVQLALLFCLVVAFYFASVSSSHITNVEESEQNIRSSIDGLRAKSQRLSAALSRPVNDAQVDLKKIRSLVAEIEEELRYMSPVQSREAGELEYRIDSCLDILASKIGGGIDAYRLGEVERLAEEALVLIHQRKTLRS